jgi:hypothetical protein
MVASTNTGGLCQVAALCWFSLVSVHRHGWKGCATCDLQTAHLGWACLVVSSMHSFQPLFCLPVLFRIWTLCCVVFWVVMNARELMDWSVCSVWEIITSHFSLGRRYANKQVLYLVYDLCAWLGLWIMEWGRTRKKLTGEINKVVGQAEDPAASHSIDHPRQRLPQSWTLAHISFRHGSLKKESSVAPVLCLSLQL